MAFDFIQTELLPDFLNPRPDDGLVKCHDLGLVDAASSMGQCHEQVLTSRLCGDPPPKVFEGCRDPATKTHRSVPYFEEEKTLFTSRI